ncbi:MAG: 50S ribosomal protein L11 methyltransferase [Oscillospiraceae bacterium]|nr:50S ribosomal protein L11 methyltransferase [Oscillospiraceae bacterium]
MKTWLEVALPAPPEEQDELLAKLVSLDFEGFQIEDDRVLMYLPVDAAESLDLLCGLSPALTIRERCEDEWADAWKQYYKPTPIGDKLLIQPAWAANAPQRMSGSDCGNERADNSLCSGRVIYLNDPGMAFGTGLHASTRLCLEIIETLDLTGKRVLDVGCGSGILSLCALLLGAENAVGVDIDPYAARTAGENAKLNGVEGRFTALAGDYLNDETLRRSAGQAGVVFSNIVADVIIPLVPVIAPSGALWIASGIIEGRLDEVLSAAEEDGLAARRVRVEDGWAAVQFGEDG